MMSMRLYMYPPQPLPYSCTLFCVIPSPSLAESLNIDWPKLKPASLNIPLRNSFSLKIPLGFLSCSSLLSWILTENSFLVYKYCWFTKCLFYCFFSNSNKVTFELPSESIFNSLLRKLRTPQVSFELLW